MLLLVLVYRVELFFVSLLNLLIQVSLSIVISSLGLVYVLLNYFSTISFVFPNSGMLFCTRLPGNVLHAI